MKEELLSLTDQLNDMGAFMITAGSHIDDVAVTESVERRLPFIRCCVTVRICVFSSAASDAAVGITSSIIDVGCCCDDEEDDVDEDDDDDDADDVEDDNIDTDGVLVFISTGTGVHARINPPTSLTRYMIGKSVMTDGEGIYFMIASPGKSDGKNADPNKNA